MLRRQLVLFYAMIACAAFAASFLYLIGFVNEVAVPKWIDSGVPRPLGQALLLDTALLLLFPLQHSGMARAGFKRAWTRIVPAPVERSTYVLLSSLTLALICWQWAPINDLVWHVNEPLWRTLIDGVSYAGWLLVLVSSLSINGNDLTGLSQAMAYFQGREYAAPGFTTPWLYRLVRHPIYFGLLIAFWFTPTMTLGHFLFALVMTIYISVGARFEERDLVSRFGDSYLAYQAEVGRILPGLGKRRRPSAPTSPQ